MLLMSTLNHLSVSFTFIMSFIAHNACIVPGYCIAFLYHFICHDCSETVLLMMMLNLMLE